MIPPRFAFLAALVVALVLVVVSITGGSGDQSPSSTTVPICERHECTTL